MPVPVTLPRGNITQARPIAAPLSLTRLTPCRPRRPPACCPPVRCSAHPNSRQDAGEVVQESTDPPLKPLRGPFVRAPLISYEKRTRACRLCAGSGTVMCEGCAGRGRLPAGGYQKRNPVTAARVVGSKWTALQRTFGWRHFQCSQKRKEGKETFGEILYRFDTCSSFFSSEGDATKVMQVRHVTLADSYRICHCCSHADCYLRRHRSALDQY